MLQAELKILVGKHAGKVIPLTSTKFLVGREQDCHLRPNSDLISRHHCVFTIDDYSVRLRDLGSTNGTRVNGKPVIGEITLAAGDTISIGKLDVVLACRKPAAVSVREPVAAVLAGAPLVDLPVGGGSGSNTASSDTSYEMTAFGNAPAGDNSAVARGDTVIGNFSPTQSAPPPPASTAPVPQYNSAYPHPQDPQAYGQQGYGAYNGPSPMGYPAANYPPGAYPNMQYGGQMPPGYYGMQPNYPVQGQYPAPQGYPQGGGYPAQGGYPPQEYAPQGYAPEAAPAAAPSPSGMDIPVRLPLPSETGAKEAVVAAAGQGGQPAAEKPSNQAADIIKKYLQNRGGR